MSGVFDKIKKIFRYPHLLPLRLIPKQLLPGSVFLKMQYRLRTGKKLNLKNPVLLNEKLQWLKLFDRKPEYSLMADKYEVRGYIEQTIGSKYLIPLLGIWNSFDDICFEKLPGQFVLKCTHDSGSIVFCHDKNKFNIVEAKKIINRSIRRNYYYHGREWAYKNIKPRIIAENLMVDESGYELKDYKIFCFNGVPKIIQVDYDRFSGHKQNFYSTEWEFLSIGRDYPSNSEINIEKPKCLALMLELAGKLSEKCSFVRVDFYLKNDEIFFGELTFFPGSGCKRFAPEWDKTMGSWLTLPEKT